MQVTVVDDVHLQTDLGLTAKALGLDLTALVNPTSHLGRGFTVKYDGDEGPREESEGQRGPGVGDGPSGTHLRSGGVGGDGGDGDESGDHVYDTAVLGTSHASHAPAHISLQYTLSTHSANIPLLTYHLF